MIGQKLLQRGWEVLIHPLFHQTRHLQMSIYFGLYKILLMEKILILWKTVNDTWNSSLFMNKKSWEDGIVKLPGKWQNIVKKKLVNTFFQ